MFWLLTLLFPGSVYLRTDKPIYALAVPVFGLLIVVTLAINRWIVNPQIFIAMNTGLIGLHILSLLHGLLLIRTQNSSTIKRPLFLYVLIISLITVIISFHRHKETWLGFGLYHIPSLSMAPTLLPGDIILVDTWTNPQDLKEGQIVLFKRHSRGLVLVKRTKRVRKTDSAGLELFLVGDNSSQSSDSRHFGWIDANNVIGLVTARLFTLSRSSQTKNENRYPVSLIKKKLSP